MQGVQRSIVNFAIFFWMYKQRYQARTFIYQSGYPWKDERWEYKFGVISIEIAFEAMELRDTETSDMCCIVVQVYI